MKLKFCKFKYDFDGTYFGITFLKGKSVESVSEQFIKKMETISGKELWTDYIIEEVDLIEKSKYDDVVKELEKYKNSKKSKSNANV